MSLRQHFGALQAPANRYASHYFGSNRVDSQQTWAPVNCIILRSIHNNGIGGCLSIYPKPHRYGLPGSHAIYLHINHQRHTIQATREWCWP